VGGFTTNSNLIGKILCVIFQPYTNFVTVPIYNTMTADPKGCRSSPQILCLTWYQTRILNPNHVHRRRCPGYLRAGHRHCPSSVDRCYRPWSRRVHLLPVSSALRGRGRPGPLALRSSAGQYASYPLWEPREFDALVETGSLVSARKGL
jgi:hypothetical protein